MKETKSNFVNQSLELGHFGLSASEVAQRKNIWGSNTFTSPSQTSWIHFAAQALLDPLTIILLLCSLIYVIIGDRTEGLLLTVSGLTVALMTFVQKFRTEKALESLKSYHLPQTEVFRDGIKQLISSKDVVPDDLVILNEGMRIPADGTVIENHSLQVDESLFSGESAPLSKLTQTNCNQVWSGTLVTRGNGLIRVSAIGLNTELGKIGTALSSQVEKTTRLQRELGKLLRIFLRFGVIFCFLVFFSYWLLMGNVLEALLAGLAAAMAMLPEELLLILNLFLALGALRLSKLKVLIRRFSALENLGAITILCVDKTGTLTENKMTVRSLSTPMEQWQWNPTTSAIPESFHSLVEHAWLASHQDPYDPMDKAIREVVNTALKQTEHFHPHWTLLREYPLTHQLLAVSAVWKDQSNHQVIIATKGAPEAIIELCHLSPSESERTLAQVATLAGQGLRILGVASASWAPSQTLPDNPHDYEFTFQGLIGMHDPLRAGVKEALKECTKAGIRVLMITGDYPETARQIAIEAGFSSSLTIISGKELSHMTDSDLSESVKLPVSFARITHEQKLRIVQVLQKQNHVVAMTGDGVNDASSLKQADVGIALGDHATDVAREASDLILLEPDFHVLVRAIYFGRRIFDNILVSLKYILSVHIPVGALTLLPVLFKWPLLFHPIHLVFLQLVIYPVCSFAIESEKDNNTLLSRPPRDVTAPLFDRTLIKSSLQRGGFTALLLLVSYGVLLFFHIPTDQSRTLVFTALLGAQWGLLKTSFSSFHSFGSLFRFNNLTFWVWLGSLSLLGISIGVPNFRGVFHFSSAPFLSLFLFFAGGLLAGAIWQPTPREITVSSHPLC